MKKNLIKILAILLSVILNIMLFACESTGNEDKNVDSPINADTHYTVTFNTNGGQAIQSVQVKKGEKVQKPSLSTKQDEIYDYELKSWQKESSEWNFETDVVTENITLVAVWEIVATRKQFLPK